MNPDDQIHNVQIAIDKLHIVSFALKGCKSKSLHKNLNSAENHLTDLLDQMLDGEFNWVKLNNKIDKCISSLEDLSFELNSGFKPSLRLRFFWWLKGLLK